MNANDGWKLIQFALEKDSDEQLYQKWLSDTARYKMSFDEYKQKHIPYQKTSQQERDELLARYGRG